MESKQFDELTKRLAAPVSRRVALKAVIVTAVGGAFGLTKVRDVAAESAPPCVTPNVTACGPQCCNPTATPLPEQCCKGLTFPRSGRCVHCASAAQVNQRTCTCCQAGSTPCGNSCFSCPGQGQVVLGAPNGPCSCGCPANTTVCNGNCVANCPSGQFLNADCQCQCILYGCGAGICCKTGSSCVNGVCVVGTCPTPGAPGAGNCFHCCSGQACTTTANTCYCVTTAEGGLTCAQPICGNVACTTNANCPTAGQVCGPGGTCITPCNTSADCKTGHACMTQGCCGTPPAGFKGFCAVGCGIFSSGGAFRPTRRGKASRIWGHVH